MDPRLLSSLLPPAHWQGSNHSGIFFGRAGRGERGEAGTMMGKAKPKKHIAKEIAAKIDAATTNREGGLVGVVDLVGR